MRYEVSRSNADKSVHVICREDEFYTHVPSATRKRGPWQVLRRGDVECLKPAYRLRLARDGFIVIETHPVGFSETV